MNIINRLFNNYLISIKHFYSIIKSELVLIFFLTLVVLSQIIFSYHSFNSVVLSLIYPIGIFLFISIAYSIVYITSNNKIIQKTNEKNYIQIVVIISAIILNFIILLGQFPKDNYLFKLSKPIRKFLFDLVDSFNFTQIINSIIINNLTAVIIPIGLLLLFSKNDIKENFSKNNLKIISYLFLLYLPIILFGEKSMNQILSYLPVYLFIAAIPEEVLFRGLLQTELVKFLSKPINAIIFASLIFGLMHLPINIKMYGNLVGLASCIGNNAFGGLFIGYLYYKTRSISTAILFHLISGIALS